MVAANKPVGVFDSGVGGLSVLQALRQELPHEHFLYVGDSGCAPYGDRSAEFVIARAIAITEFLVSQGAKADRGGMQHRDGGRGRVAARALSRMPIVAIEPAVKPAASRTRSRVVGVLATTGTLSSPNIGKLLANYGSDVEFVIQPCPGLADQVEKGELASDETRALVRRYVRPIVDKGGGHCRAGMHALSVPALDHSGSGRTGGRHHRPGDARCARAAAPARIRGSVERCGRPGTEQFWTTGTVEIVGPIVRQLWGPTAKVAGLKAGTTPGERRLPA